MITICNTLEVVDGKHKYAVKIEGEVITTFSHSRLDGLAACLDSAATAVRHTESARVTKFLESVRNP